MAPQIFTPFSFSIKVTKWPGHVQVRGFVKQNYLLLRQSCVHLLATSNEGLVQKLLQASIITKERVVQAMKTVDRYKAYIA